MSDTTISSGLAAAQQPRTRFGKISLSFPGFWYLCRFAFDFTPAALQHLCTRLSETLHPVSFRIDAATLWYPQTLCFWCRSKINSVSNLQFWMYRFSVRRVKHGNQKRCAKMVHSITPSLQWERSRFQRCCPCRSRKYPQIQERAQSSTTPPVNLRYKKQVFLQPFKCCKNTRHGARGGTWTRTSIMDTRTWI